MRLSELSGKEVINIGDGARLGVIDECEIAFDVKSGRIHSFILPAQRSFFNFLNEGKSSTIPWNSIKRIGDEIVIVDLHNAFDRLSNNIRRNQSENTY